ASAQRSACVGLVQDEKVFMVLGGNSFGVGNVCVAQEFKTPIITFGGGDPIFDSTYEQAWPNLFALGLSWSRALRNHPSWAAEMGVYKDKKLGIYYANDPTFLDGVKKDFKPAMAKL